MGTFAYIPQATNFPSSTGPANYAEDVFDTENPTLLSPNPPLGTVSSYIDSKGRALLFKLVKLDSTTFPASLLTGPVYYKDETQQVVTTNESEAVAGENSYAGMLLNLSAANGQLVWIQVGGYLGSDSDAGFGAQPVSTAAFAVGETVVGASGQQVMAVVASGTAPTYRPIGIVVKAAAAGSDPFDIVLIPNYI